MQVVCHCRRGMLSCRFLLWPAILIALLGCGRENDDVAPVTGVVTLDGRPLTQGTVVFTPEKGRWAKGTIRSDGSFRLSSTGDEGATVGLNRVSIICVEPGAESEDKLAKWLIPPHYGNPATSGLSFDVKAGVHNTAQFDLTQ